MIFREVQNNTTWGVYNNIINHNVGELGKLKIPLFLKRSYAKLVAFYPFTEKQEITYFNLSLNKRLPYLLNYLIKVGRKNGLKKSSIDRLVELKNNYDNRKMNKYSTVEYTDRMMMYLISKDYDSILDLHLANDKIRSSFEIFAEYTKLLINHLIDDEVIKIRKNHKVWKTNRMAIEARERGEDRIRTAPDRYVPRFEYGVPSERKKSKSFFDLNIAMDKVSEDVSEWDKFIEEEIGKRIDKKINELSKKSKSEKKSQDNYYNDSTVGDYGTGGLDRPVVEDRLEEVQAEEQRPVEF